MRATAPHIALAGLAAVALAVAPATARGDNAWSGNIPAKARALADRGRAYHDAGDYAAAIAAFTQAYVIAPSPALLFNLAQAYRLQGSCDDAALMYQRYLATNPSPEGRALAQTHLASVERCMHKLALHIPLEDTPVQLAIPIPPAPIAVTKAAPPVSRKAQLEKDIGIGLGLGGSIAVATAVYFTIQAHDAENEVAAAYSRGDKWKDIAPIDERGKTAAADARIFGIGGALGLASGVTLYLLGRHTERAARPVMSVTPTSHGAEASVRWRF
ncbi:MAG TPA: tetratricopeptide repeat protein [Kofleriaceae bacterium]|nr:tetratricopeptide repeat protein [Kofleriaceae bacterium]